MNSHKIYDTFPLLETPRLILRELQESDAEDLYNIFSDEQVMKHYDISPIKSLDEALSLIHILDRRFKNKKGIRWGIFSKSCNKIVGSCGFQSIDEDCNRAEIGYELSQEFWGQGVMKEALDKIIEFGFYIIGLNRIQALVEPENKNSLKLLKKIGFKEEGILREYEYYKDKYVDLVMLSLLKSAFES